MLDVAALTVRETLRILSHINVLDVGCDEGTFAILRLHRGDIGKLLSLLSLQDHLDLRARLEPEAAGRATRESN